MGLRGSSDIHAFGDSNLYLRRGKEHLVLCSEHRAVPASPPIHLALVTINLDTTHLEDVALLEDGKPCSLEEQVLDSLTGGMVLTRAKLRDCLAVRNERLGEVLKLLERAGWFSRAAAGWHRLD